MTDPLHRPLGTAPGEAFGPDAWPRILIDPTESRLDHDTGGWRFFLAPLVSAAATVVLLVAVWAVVS